MEVLSSGQLAAALAVVGAAYVVRGIAGFGSGLIATPLLLLLLPLTLAVPLVVILDYAASAVQGIRDRRRIAWREIVHVLPTAVAGVAVAFWLFKLLDPQVRSTSPTSMAGSSTSRPSAPPSPPSSCSTAPTASPATRCPGS